MFCYSSPSRLRYQVFFQPLYIYGNTGQFSSFINFFLSTYYVPSPMSGARNREVVTRHNSWSPGVCLGDQASTSVRWARRMPRAHSRALNGVAREQRDSTDDGETQDYGGYDQPILDTAPKFLEFKDLLQCISAPRTKSQWPLATPSSQPNSPFHILIVMWVSCFLPWKKKICDTYTCLNSKTRILSSALNKWHPHFALDIYCPSGIIIITGHGSCA